MRLLGDCDIISLAGAAKTLAAPVEPAYFETAMHQIALAVSLHGIDAVILVNHEDCGAYGGRQAFGSAEAEQPRRSGGGWPGPRRRIPDDRPCCYRRER
jgi:hypothetical protein